MTTPAEQFESLALELQQGRPSLSILQIAWRRKSLIVLGIVIGLIIGALFYARMPPTYQSYAQLMVIKKGNPLTPGGGDPRSVYYEDYMSSHVTLIKASLIVQEAVKKRQLNSLKMYQGLGDPTGEIIGSLQILRDPNAPSGTFNNILNVSCRGGVPDECGVVLNAVIESYRNFLDNAYKTVSSDTVAKITQVTDELQRQLKERHNALKEFQEKSPLVYWKGGEGINPREELLAQINNKKLTQEVRQAELAAQLKTFRDGEGGDRVKLLAIISHSASKVGKENRAMEDQLLLLRIEEERLLSKYGDQHPDVVDVRRRRSRIEEYLNDSPNRKNPEAKGDVYPIDPVQRHLLALEQDYHEVTVSLVTLRKLSEEVEKEARELNRWKVREKQLHDEVRQTELMFEPIRKKLDEIRLSQEMGGYDIRVIAQPGGGVKVGPIAYQVFALAIIIGTLIGLGMAYIAEITDKSFRTPDEIRRRLGLPVVGHIPVLRQPTAAQSEGSPLDPSLCSHFQPKSVQAEAYRGVRTALYFSTKGEVHKVIQMTSPLARDGKSTMTSNLGICIAQSGKRVLLVDADMRKPRLHKIFGVSAPVGLSNVIADNTRPLQAVQETAVPNLYILPCGPRPHNPAELLTSPRFPEVIAELRKEFDFVLIDTPPLLAVSDPSVVAARVDGVILVLRVTKNGQPNAERAKEILQTIGANVIGVVVNGVGRGPGGGGYDYNRYYNYYYDYDYTYGYENDYNTYYTEDGKEEGPATADQDGASPQASTAPPSSADDEATVHPDRPPVPPGESPSRHRRHRSRSGSHGSHSRSSSESKGLLATLFPWWNR